MPGKTTIQLHHDRLELPLTWKEPRLIFVNSMADLFHEEVPEDFIMSAFRVMGEARHHTFQVLTKRHKRLSALAPKLPLPTNVWVGVSVENQRWADERIPELKKVPAAVRFLSCEPLLGKMDLRKHLRGLQWVIVGGESGVKARPINPVWVETVRDQCVRAGVPFFW